MCVVLRALHFDKGMKARKKKGKKVSFRFYDTFGLDFRCHTTFRSWDISDFKVGDG